MGTSSNCLSDPLRLGRCRHRALRRRSLLATFLQAVVDLARVQPGMHLRLLLLQQREAAQQLGFVALQDLQSSLLLGLPHVLGGSCHDPVVILMGGGGRTSCRRCGQLSWRSSV